MVLSATLPTPIRKFQMKTVIYDTVLTASDGSHPAMYSRRMTHPARDAYAGTHYRSHSRWSRVVVGFGMAILTSLALIGAAACRHL